MLHEGVIVGCALAYAGLLFWIAWFGDKRAEAGRSIIANPYVYTLSFGVFCTAWTFYGSVGWAASTGVGFLPTYLGSTLVGIVFWTVLRRIVRIAKTQHITSIADFIASRYGKSSLLGGIVTVIAAIGVVLYISIQLEAVTTTFEVLRRYPKLVIPGLPQSRPVWLDTSFYVSLMLIAYAILFGTRHIDATERHEGVVAAVAFESIFKLIALTAVGIYITYFMYDGAGDIFRRAAADPWLRHLLTFEAVPGGYSGWLAVMFLGMAAVLFLPRQFQVMVVENVDESHLRTASWLFPLYLLVTSLFVLPIAMAGLLHMNNGVMNADTLMLDLPMAAHQSGLALLVFLGGLSAATGMIVVEMVALSNMICNDLVIPILLRLHVFGLGARADLTRWLLRIRRLSIATMVLLGYVFFRFVGGVFPLVTTGLLSLAAAAQLAPPILFGIYWRRANRVSVYIGLSAGFAMWCYTLFLPFSGWLGPAFIKHGPFGIAALKPQALLGLSDLEPLTHGVFWSMLVNVAGIVLGSLFTRAGAVEQIQANRFVDIFEHGRLVGGSVLWRGRASVGELRELVARFFGSQRVALAFDSYAQRRGHSPADYQQATPALMHFSERMLAGAIGAASARVVLSSIERGEPLGLDEVMAILEESSAAIRYSHELEHKSKELENAYTKLREVYLRLTELNQLKDEFVSTVSHELRTPLASISASSEILLQEPSLSPAESREFLTVIAKESSRLARLINQVLDVAKMESGDVEWRLERLDLRAVIDETLRTVRQLLQIKRIALRADLGQHDVQVIGNSDRLTQVLINLLSNAVEFCPQRGGRVSVRLASEAGHVRLTIADNGPGIPPDQLESIFLRFHQVHDAKTAKPKGTGLGLAISRRIVERHGGRIWAQAATPRGACFVVELPCAAPWVEPSPFGS